jgi:drug/metabolite transporter (DMT)-like permease
VFISSLSQVLLKISANKTHKDGIREYLNFHVVSAYGLFFISTILTVLALRGISVNRAPVLESVGYLYVMVLSRLILKEKITIKKLLGNVLIILGIIIFSYNF